LYAQNKASIDVVLTDMMMPYLDGTAAIRALLINPSAKETPAAALPTTGKLPKPPPWV
jgi:CheY-like chemotaxis protein